MAPNPTEAVFTEFLENQRLWGRASLLGVIGLPLTPRGQVTDAV